MKGLSLQQVETLRAEHGYNELAVKNGNPWYLILLSQFKDILVGILLVAAIISLFHDTTEAFVIFGIIILNAGIGFFQEFRTEKTLEALQKMVHPEIRVIRDGEELSIGTKELVPGDIIILGEGDKVPADGKMIEVHSLRVEESALTGESLPLEKKKDDFVYMGTSVARGSGIVEITKIGMSTEFGKIAELTTQTDKTKSPLQIELERIGIFVAKVTGVVCVILFGIQLWRTLGSGGELVSALVTSLTYSVSVAIAAVPEGLPTTVTIALALGASVLARKKTIVKKLSSVETLGAVTTICSDKTGTLTKNEMTVREIYLADRSIFQVSGVGYNPNAGEIQFLGGNSAKRQVVKDQTIKGKRLSFENTALLKQVFETCTFCNEAKLVQQDGFHRILGDPTEGALLTLSKKAFNQDKRYMVDTEHEHVQEVFPFDSDRKMMSVVVQNDEERKVLVKGSPDQVLEKCTQWFDGNEFHPMDDAKREQIRSHYDRMASNALRVLAFAYKPLTRMPKTEKTAEKDLVFCGLVGMIDPPRQEVKDAVERCHSAGIRVVVITGDYGITAKAIAQELGIVRENHARVLTGAEVKEMTDDELEHVLSDKNKDVIFARALPEQKMKIVEILQGQGEIVAMTGDGVNDAPALKKANIGVAMGITGTEVSKEAATMVLLDDSFASIVTAVEEGRRIYQNLKKFIWFIFSCNIGELFVIFSAILFSFPTALTAILILCIDLGTDILPAIALGVDNPDKDLMKDKPRDPKQKVMTRKFVEDFFITGMVVGICVTGAFLYTLITKVGWSWGDPYDSVDLDYPRTVAFTSLVMVQLFNAFSARSATRSVFTMNPLKNSFLLVAIFTSVLMVFSMLYIPQLNDILKTTPLSVADWQVVLIASIIPLFVVEIMKWMKRKI